MDDAGGFREHVGIEVVGAGDGRATATLVAGDEHLNPHGTVHGGAIATLCDTAMGTAVHVAGADAPATVEMKVTYLRPGAPGELRAEALVRKRGKKIIAVEVEVSQGEETIALGTATFTDLA